VPRAGGFGQRGGFGFEDALNIFMRDFGGFGGFGRPVRGQGAAGAGRSSAAATCASSWR
jgi:molecular chaperone DnaJ